MMVGQLQTGDGAPVMVSVTDHERVAVHVCGRGRPVLLLPGLGYAAWSFQPQRQALREDHQVLALDHRGVGHSDPAFGPFTVAGMADDAAAVLDALSLSAVDVVGASMGGYVALTLAQRHPQRVRSLTVIASSPGGPAAVGVPPATAAAWAAAAGLGPEEFARATMPLSLRPGWPQEHPQRYHALLRARLSVPTDPRTWRAQNEACERHLRNGLAPHPISVPTLVIHGGADRVVPVVNAAQAAQVCSNVVTVTLPDAGHLCWLEEPDVVTEAIRRHLAGVAISEEAA